MSVKPLPVWTCMSACTGPWIMISYMMSSSFFLKYTVDTYFKKLLGSPNYKDCYVFQIITTTVFNVGTQQSQEGKNNKISYSITSWNLTNFIKYLRTFHFMMNAYLGCIDVACLPTLKKEQRAVREKNILFLNTRRLNLRL
jgi:hypothetical protein